MIEGLDAETLAADFRAVADLAHDVENPPEVSTTRDAHHMHAVPGSRLPPGMAEILHADATASALALAYELSAYVAHVIADRCGEALRPSSVEGAQVLVDMTFDAEGRYIAYGICDDLRTAREALAAVVRRYQRVIQTGHACLDLACAGRYVVPQHDARDDALRCDRCGHSVSFEVWHTWAPAWVSLDTAARKIGITVAAAKMRAKRQNWERCGKGRDVRYSAADVQRSKELLLVAA